MLTPGVVAAGEEVHLASLDAKLDDRISGLVEYRRSEVDSVAGLGTPERVSYEFSEIRVGVRFSFDLRVAPRPAS